MTAGLNYKVNIIQNNYAADDAVGGAQVTGTVAYADIPASLAARRPSQASLEQGLEVNRVFDMTINGRNVTINERDEVQVVWPPWDNPYYNERFRVTGLQYSRRRRAFGHTKCTLSRIERSRSNNQ